MSNGWSQFRYRDFCDVPRLIVLEHAGNSYILNCAFDNQKDDYSDCYVVYKVDNNTALKVESLTDWTSLLDLAKLVGTVNVSDLQFDATKRKAISENIFERISFGNAQR